MLRRAMLMLALAAPLAALGQSLTIVPPSPYTQSQCDGTATSNVNATINWSMGSGVTMPVTPTYRILVSTVSECPSGTLTSTAKQLVGDIVPDTTVGDLTGLTSQRYPAVGGSPLTLKTIASTAGIDCTANQTVYLCVQLMSGTTTVATTGTPISLVFESGPPSTPINVFAAPGDKALNISWADGTDGSVAADHYTVTVKTFTCDPANTPTPYPTSCLGPLVNQGTTPSHAIRLGGLANGALYGVQVTAVSAGGTLSPTSAIAVGIPVQTFDFWDAYVNAGGQDPGGCGGGPAGVLSLLAVAGLVRSLRRRS